MCLSSHIGSTTSKSHLWLAYIHVYVCIHTSFFTWAVHEQSSKHFAHEHRTSNADDSLCRSANPKDQKRKQCVTYNMYMYIMYMNTVFIKTYYNVIGMFDSDIKNEHRQPVRSATSQTPFGTVWIYFIAYY